MAATRPLRRPGYYRVFRGGSWYYIAQYCRVAFRYDSTPDYRDCLGGLRLAL